MSSQRYRVVPVFSREEKRYRGGKIPPEHVSEEVFLDFPRWLYRNDPHWVCPLDMEIKNIFNPYRNPMYEGGDAQRWVVINASGQVVGRIAAFYNERKAKRYKVPVGGAGFFECIEDQEAANLLFETAKHWLQARGMAVMEAPVNFGENDRHWGLLVEGFVQPGFGMPYNPPYYEKLFLEYGFEPYFEQVTKHLDITKPMPERFQNVWRWISSKPNIRFDHARKDQLVKYVDDFITVYNDAWQYHEHFVPLQREKVLKAFSEFKHIIIERFLIYAYVENEPAGVLFCLPDLNQIIKPFRGKPTWWDLLLFLWRKRNDYEWYRKRGILTRGRVILIGVRPRFQKYGLEVGLAMYSMDDARKMGFQEIELGWVGDFNPLSRRLQEATGAKPGKIHRTYRYVFDPAMKSIALEGSQIIRRTDGKAASSSFQL